MSDSPLSPILSIIKLILRDLRLNPAILYPNILPTFELLFVELRII